MSLWISLKSLFVTLHYLNQFSPCPLALSILQLTVCAYLHILWHLWHSSSFWRKDHPVALLQLVACHVKMFLPADVLLWRHFHEETWLAFEQFCFQIWLFLKTCLNYLNIPIPSRHNLCVSFDSWSAVSKMSLFLEVWYFYWVGPSQICQIPLKIQYSDSDCFLWVAFNENLSLVNPSDCINSRKIQLLF